MTPPAVRCLLPAGSRRRGSVLILVVTLLVLMALAGTAYLATVRTDRLSTAVSTDIHQEQMLLDSAQALIAQKLIDDIYGINSDEGWDHPNDDKWLADRVPTWMGPASTGFPVWRFLTDLVEDSSTVYRFDSPFTSGFPLLPGEKIHYRLQPDVDATSGLPAILIRDNAGNDLGLDLQPAADADGDGIADSPYLRLPGRVGDVTYFIGARVIDNTAAVNVNTAFDRNFDHPLPTNPITNNSEPPRSRQFGFFPSTVGLMQLLSDYDATTNWWSPEIANITHFHFNQEGGSDYLVTTDQPFTDQFVPTNILPAARPDIAFATLGEALWSQLARRIDNPGYSFYSDTPLEERRFRAYPISEMAAMAYRFTLKNLKGDVRTLLELDGTNRDGIPTSVVSTDIYTAPYNTTANPRGVEDWFLDNFDYGNSKADSGWTRRHVRPLLVTHNPVSNRAPLHVDSDTGNVPASIAALPTTDAPRTDPDADYSLPIYGVNKAMPAPRANINTATFGELWRAFWAVMHENNTAQIPAGSETRMFRLEHTGLTTPHEQLQLRAALAAVNVEDLRDYDDNVSEHVIQIGDKTITVFGIEKQPFITEVIVHLGGLPGRDDDYIAVELYNPYYLPASPHPVAGDGTIRLENWMLAAYNRTAGTFTLLHTFTDTDVIEPRGFLTVESDDALRQTFLDRITPPAVPVVVKLELRDAIGQELVLLRPRSATNQPSGPEVANPTGDEIAEYVPVDQVNLTAMDVEAETPVEGERWHYARVAPDAAAAATDEAWRCVYPYPGPAALTGTDPRDYGFEQNIAAAGTLGAANTDQTFLADSGDIEFIIPLNDFGWPARTTAGVPTGTDSYPYGGFPRNGDILMVPYIGSYTIRQDNVVVAMNSVTLDAAYVEGDKTTVADNGQHVGRFAPINKNGGVAVGYEWTRDLFDHVSVHVNPDDDYLPNINPQTYLAAHPSAGVPQPVPNGPVSSVAAANNGNETTVGTHGLININTAPPMVLNALPLVQSLDPGATTVEIGDYEMANRDLAFLIWQSQMTRRYESAFDLLEMPEIREMNPASPVNAATQDFDETHGDITPYETASPAGDGVLDDFEQHYMPLTRLSNLITTRSDSFTVYIVLEGWRDAGTPNATRVSQQRRAFIVDRSVYTPANPRLGITPIPME